MQNLVEHKQNRFFIFLKLLILVVIFYAIINYLFSGNLKRLNTDKNFYQTGEKSFIGDDEAWQNWLGKHDIALSEQENTVDYYKNLDGEQNEFLIKFQAICLSNITFCSKIKFQGDYSSKDKYMYLATSIYLLKYIEENLTTEIQLRNQLKNIFINNNRGTRRGFANRDSITINLGAVTSYVEFMELVVHEIGHVVDLGIVRGKSKYKHKLYTEFDMVVFEVDDPSIDYYKLSWDSEKIRNSEAKKEDFCSSYGMTDPFEDFAECHNLYLNHNLIFKYWAKHNEVMQKKYNFMSNLYGGKYMFDSSKDLEKVKLNNFWRPWDTTKM